MTWSELIEVWSPLSILAALVSGLIVGYLLVGRFASDPAYASGVSTPIEYGIVAAVLAAALGAIFYGLQIATSWFGGDTAWTRVVSRFGLWALYSVAIGIGTWIRLNRHIARKHAEAHERAVAELGAPEDANG